VKLRENLLLIQRLFMPKLAHISRDLTFQIWKKKMKMTLLFEAGTKHEGNCQLVFIKKISK